MRSLRVRTKLGKAALVVVAVALFGLLAHAGLSALGAEVGPPKPRITSAPIRSAISKRATFAFSGAPGVTFECSVDDVAFLACSSPVTYRGLELGAHEFRVRAHDRAGISGKAATYTWTIVVPRRRPPVLPAAVVPRPIMTTVPVRPWTSRSATFAWISRSRLVSQCSLDLRPWRRCRSPKTYRALALGRHVFRVRTMRGDGRRSRPNRFIWTITASMPPAAPRFVSSPSESTTETSAEFVFEGDENAAGFECRVDEGVWQRCSSPVLLVGVGVGRHTFCVRAVDSEGVAGPETCETWTVEAGSDPAPPPVSAGTFSISGDLPGLLAPGSGGTIPLTVTNPLGFDLTVTDLVVTVLPGSSQAGCDGPTNLAVVQSNTAGGAVSITVPAGSSVTLPAQGATAPQLSMLDLPTNQDACKGAVFSLSFAGTGMAP